MFRIGVPLKGEVAAPIGEADRFGVVEVEKGEIKGVHYYPSLQPVFEKVDYFVVTSDREEVGELLELGIEVLVTPYPEVGIGEIVEGFLFKELFRYRS